MKGQICKQCQILGRVFYGVLLSDSFSTSWPTSAFRKAEFTECDTHLTPVKPVVFAAPKPQPDPASGVDCQPSQAPSTPAAEQSQRWTVDGKVQAALWVAVSSTLLLLAPRQTALDGPFWPSVIPTSTPHTSFWGCTPHCFSVLLSQCFVSSFLVSQISIFVYDNLIH